MFNINKVCGYITVLRKEKRLTRKKLAEILGISRETIINWENGDELPDITLLPLLAKTLGKSIDDIFASGEDGFGGFYGEDAADLREEADFYISERESLEKEKENIKHETERRKAQLEEYKNKTEKKLKIIKNKRKMPGISNAAVRRLDEIYGEIADRIDEIDDEINELYDEMDEKTEKIDERIYEINEKIDEINELIDERDENADEKLIREIEEELKRIDGE